MVAVGPGKKNDGKDPVMVEVKRNGLTLLLRELADSALDRCRSLKPRRGRCDVSTTSCSAAGCL